MKRSLKLPALLLLVMTCAAVTAYAMTPRTRLAVVLPRVSLDQRIPEAFADWHVDKDLPVSIINPQQSEFLATLYSDVLTRTYLNTAGDRVMLSIAYGADQSDETSVHFPDVCYPAQGFQIFSARTDVLKMDDGYVSVRRLIAKAGTRNEPLTYWLVVGDKAVLGSTQRKLAQLAYGFGGVIPDGLIFRVSSISPDADRAYALQDDFVRKLARELPESIRDRTIGKVVHHDRS